MGEGGGKDRANKEKELFVEIFFWKKWPLSSRGEGYGLNGLAISGGTFFAASLMYGVTAALRGLLFSPESPHRLSFNQRQIGNQ